MHCSGLRLQTGSENMWFKLYVFFGCPCIVYIAVRGFAWFVQLCIGVMTGWRWWSTPIGC